jgi:choice-of-anchor B domain-containing protein
MFKKIIFAAFAFIAIASSVSAQTNLSLLGHYPYPNGVSASNLTGYVDTAGNEYALVGTSTGLSIVDISVPTNPTQLYLVPGATGQGAFWREVREYNGFAYVTTEQSSGLQVVDLRWLPDSIGYHTINPMGITTSHTVFIDENGIAYINGTNVGVGGVVFLDLNANPWNPPVLGNFNNNYMHDCFARNDTMWGALINDGFLKVVDVTNKANTNVQSNTLTTFATPNNFTHNCWLSDDSKYIFTTDERPDSYLACYDVSDLNNVTETDRIQVDPGSNTIIHNTYYMNDYCITSYYTYGIAIFDVTRKNNLQEVGNYDTSPSFTGDGFNGAWGVWPYLPSGNIIASDIETGLWILQPTYQRSCYLEGLVKDSVCQTALNNVTIEILSSTVTDQTNFTGKYATGILQAGTYTVRFSKQGYATKDYPGTVLTNGVLTTINVDLVPVSTTSLTINTLDAATQQPIPFTRVIVKDDSGVDVVSISTDNSGTTNFCDFVNGTYSVIAGKWGYVEKVDTQVIDPTNSTINIYLNQGYYDDFLLDYGWTKTGTASSGDWEKGEPVGTDYQGVTANTEDDIPGDNGIECYVTGNGGGAAGDDDVDNGSVSLKSPLFDLTNYGDAYISYYRWFFNNGGNGSTPNDSLVVILWGGQNNSTILETVLESDSFQSQWKFKNYRVTDYLPVSTGMQVEFRASDANPGHLVEAGVDVFSIVDSAVINSMEDVAGNTVIVSAYPNPFSNTITVDIQNQAGTNLQAEVINALGQTIIKIPVSGHRQLINLGEGLQTGMYILRLTDNKNVVSTTRLVKLK